jgi:hypothetical protein
LLLLATTWSGVAAAEEAPSRLKVIGLSLLLPGLGHYSIHHTTRGGAFMAADLGIWGGFSGFRLQGHLRRKSYVEMAHLFAGVPSADGRSDEYYRLVGQFPSSDIYDEEVRRDARNLYGNDLQARDAYYNAHKIPVDQVWQWGSDADWTRYKNKRNASQSSYKRARYLLGLAVANRLLAAVDAMRLVHAHGEGEGMSFYLSGDPSEPREPVRLCVSLRLP